MKKVITKKTTLALSALALLLLLNLSAAYSFEISGKDKDSKELSVEDSLMVEELISEMDNDILNEQGIESELSSNAAFKVYNVGNQLIFSGSQADWSNQKNKELIMIKRKAEYLFESDGTKIYMIF